MLTGSNYNFCEVQATAVFVRCNFTKLQSAPTAVMEVTQFAAVANTFRIHLNRCVQVPGKSARYKETKDQRIVTAPLQGLDCFQFMDSGVPVGRDVFDLISVLNHHGGTSIHSGRCL